MKISSLLARKGSSVATISRGATVSEVVAQLVSHGIGALVVATEIRRKNLARWLGPYLRDLWSRPRPRPGTPIDVLICVADHYEPKSQDADVASTTGA